MPGNKTETCDLRNMVTHLQLVNPEDIIRFAELKTIAVPQPYWFVIDTYYTQAVEYVGQPLADQQYPMKSFFDAGATVASASDYPVTVPPDPMVGIEIGVTRTVPKGSEAYVDPNFDQTLVPSERVTVEQMIASFTINGVYASLWRIRLDRWKWVRKPTSSSSARTSWILTPPKSTIPRSC